MIPLQCYNHKENATNLDGPSLGHLEMGSDGERNECSYGDNGKQHGAEEKLGMMGRVGNAMRISNNEHRPSLDRLQVQGALTSCTGHRGSGTDEIGS